MKMDYGGGQQYATPKFTTNETNLFVFCKNLVKKM